MQHEKRGHLSPPRASAPLSLDPTIPPVVSQMVRLLLQHQQTLADPRLTTVVIQRNGNQLRLKMSADLPV